VYNSFIAAKTLAKFNHNKMKSNNITINLKLELIEKLRENKKETGLSINKQANTAINNYFKYKNKSHCKKF
jgi:hypothetical protein